MKITCPHCGLVGTIGEEKLKASSGSVRCPRCHKTFSPGDESAPAESAPGRGRSAPSKKGVRKEEPVLVGARTGDDLPFTKIMGKEELLSDSDVLVEIEGSGDSESLDGIDTGEIISLGDEDIITMEDDELGPVEGDFDFPEEIPAIEEAVPAPGEIPEVVTPTPTEGQAAPMPKRGFVGLLGPRKPAAEPASVQAPRPARRRPGLRNGFILIFVVVLALWGGYRFFSAYWPPYIQEKEFLTDSRALFDKYHELRVYLKVGMPDPVFATKVAETAYVWEVYREKHDSRYRKDPLYASLMIMGRLFLTIKELLDRDMYPDNYLGLEWGEGLSFPTKEEYVGAMVAGIPICIKATEEDFLFSKQLLDLSGNFNFFSMTASRILKRPVGPSRMEYAADLKRVNNTFTTLDTRMPVLEKAVADVRSIVAGVSGK
jgi:predicted Zn finger-like uncharacterized protein